jgi:acid phosphatase (class A)
MNTRTVAAGLALAVVMLAVALVEGQDTSTPPRAATGYLSPAEMPDVRRIVPPPPQDGDSRFTTDMAIFRSTRALEGTPRWALALNDDELSTPALLRDFSCALGVTATTENAPRVTALVAKAIADASRASNDLKNFYQHKRPFQLAEGAVCVTPAGKARLERNFDYPSGHTTSSWEAALVLAELAPDAASGILSRARVFGESRVVCGVHNLSAIGAGWMTATAVFVAQHGSPAFRADMDAARADLAALRKNGTVDTAACATEAEILAKIPY